MDRRRSGNEPDAVLRTGVPRGTPIRSGAVSSVTCWPSRRPGRGSLRLDGTVDRRTADAEQLGHLSGAVLTAGQQRGQVSLLEAELRLRTVRGAQPTRIPSGCWVGSHAELRSHACGVQTRMLDTSLGPVEVSLTPGVGGQAVLVFPGGHSSAATPLGADLYTDLGYRVLTFSRPGYGRSRVGSRTAAEFVPAVPRHSKVGPPSCAVWDRHGQRDRQLIR